MTDYRAYESSEFAADWIRPAGIGQTLANRFAGYVVCLSRSRTAPPFGEREVAIHRLVAQHLNNLHACHEKIAACNHPAVTLAELSPGCSLLSTRESEIVRLMAMRLTAKEAARVYSQDLAAVSWSAPRAVPSAGENRVRFLERVDDRQVLRAGLLAGGALGAA